MYLLLPDDAQTSNLSLKNQHVCVSVWDVTDLLPDLLLRKHTMKTHTNKYAIGLSVRGKQQTTGPKFSLVAF